MSDGPSGLVGEKLWGGIALKLANANFHFHGMGKALLPPERTAYNVALESAGAIVGGNWHSAFYAHLDAFLSAARSIPEIIRCCFGEDRGNQTVRDWFDTLDQDEQDRRKAFGARFDADYKS